MSADASDVEQSTKDYDLALALKNEGNKYLKENDYAKALKSYSKIIIHIGMNPEQKQDNTSHEIKFNYHSFKNDDACINAKTGNETQTTVVTGKIILITNYQ